MIIPPDAIALVQVIFIDIALAGDNAIVVGAVASRVAPAVRRNVIIVGISGAVVLRIALASITTQLLSIVGLVLAGGILLLWVCWKMYRELPQFSFIGAQDEPSPDDYKLPEPTNVDFWSAVGQILVADLSMSLDNVLAVSGAAKGHTWVLVVGLTVSIIMMAVAASYIARLMLQFPWITWIGLVIILSVSLDMIARGVVEISCLPLSTAQCDATLFSIAAKILTGQ